MLEKARSFGGKPVSQPLRPARTSIAMSPHSIASMSKEISGRCASLDPVEDSWSLTES